MTDAIIPISDFHESLFHFLISTKNRRCSAGSMLSGQASRGHHVSVFRSQRIEMLRFAFSFFSHLRRSGFSVPTFSPSSQRSGLHVKPPPKPGPDFIGNNQPKPLSVRGNLRVNENRPTRITRRSTRSTRRTNLRVTQALGTITKLPAAATCRVRSSWIWSRAPWTRCAQGRLVSSSVRTTSSSAKLHLNRS